MKTGFSWQNSIELEIDKNGKTNKVKARTVLKCLKFAKDKDIAKFYINEDDDFEESISSLYQFLENKYGTSKPFYYISWDKNKIHQYFIDHFSNKKFVDRPSNDDWWDDVTQFFMDKLHYRTEREEVIKKDNSGQNSLNNLKEIKNQKFEIKINSSSKKLTLPSKKEWELLNNDWKKEQIKESNSSIEDFLSKHKVFKNQKLHQHQKVRKMFSLPIITGQGYTLQKRKSWNEKDIFQIWSDSDSRTDGNKFSNLASNKSNLKEVVNKSFISEKQFKLSLKPKDFFLKTDDYKKINPNQWYKISIPQELKEYIKNLEYQLDDVTRPQIRIIPSKKLSDQFISAIAENPLTKPRNKENLDKLKESSQPIEYKGSGLSEKVKQALIEAIKTTNRVSHIVKKDENSF